MWPVSSYHLAVLWLAVVCVGVGASVVAHTRTDPGTDQNTVVEPSESDTALALPEEHTDEAAGRAVLAATEPSATVNRSLSTQVPAPLAAASANKTASRTKDEIKKSIQAKAKKLRKLKQEARHIEDQLRKERRRHSSIVADESHHGKLSKRDKLQKWKARMRHRVQAIVKRVNKLEKTLRAQKQKQFGGTLNRHRAVDGLAQGQTKRGQRRHKGTRHTTLAAPLTAPTTPVSVILTSRLPLQEAHRVSPTSSPTAKSMAKRHTALHGPGSPCESHLDCIPGSCCHRMSGLGVHNSVCLSHNYGEGTHCTHSCSCSEGLKCVKSINIQTHAKQQAHCHRLRPDEVARLIALSDDHHNSRFHVHN